MTNNNTYVLAHIMANTTESLTQAEVLMREPGMGAASKHWVKTCIVNKLTTVQRDIATLLPADAGAEMKAEMLGLDMPIQFAAVKNDFLMLPQEDRDEVEALIAKLKNKKK